MRLEPITSNAPKSATDSAQRVAAPDSALRVACTGGGQKQQFHKAPAPVPYGDAASAVSKKAFVNEKKDDEVDDNEDQDQDDDDGAWKTT